MSKVTIGRIFDLSKALATKSGKELEEPLRFLAEFSELALRSLRNGLNFEDNISCETKTIKLRHNEETAVGLETRRSVTRVYLDRVIDSKYYVVTGFGWKYNVSGQLVIKALLADAPPETVTLTANIVIHYA